ncbi:MAG TPA: hypothetical protein VK191_16905 [Symbiobacteriaceae bacterium]|nr:hypothetical protein [Symbiobacteriaceae bacterium]
MIAAVPLVAAWGFAEPLVCIRLTLPEPALEVLEWRKTVLVDKADVAPDKVILNGRLRARCLFVTRDSGDVPPAPGTVSACKGLVAAAAGTVRMAVVDYGFVTLIRAPRADPGMRVSLVDAYVSGEQSRPVALSQDGLITQVLDESVLFVSVNVLTPVEVRWPKPTPYRPLEPVWREVQPEVVIAASAEPMLDEPPAWETEPVPDEVPALAAEPSPDETPTWATEPLLDEPPAWETESVLDAAPALADVPLPEEAPALADVPVPEEAPALASEPVPEEAPARIMESVFVQDETGHRPAPAAPRSVQRQMKRLPAPFTWVNPNCVVPTALSGTHKQRK